MLVSSCLTDGTDVTSCYWFHLPFAKSHPQPAEANEKETCCDWGLDFTAYGNESL